MNRMLLFVDDGFQPLGRGGALIARMSSQMLKPGICLRSMPMLDPFGNVNNVTRQQSDGRFPPLLIPASSRDTDQDLMESMMNVPVIAASRFESHVGKTLYRLLTLRQIFWLDGSQMTIPDEIASITGVNVSSI